MNFLKQSSEQAREAFTAMPLQSRLISAMLVAAIAIGLAFLVRGDGGHQMEPLFGGRLLSEQEMDAIVLVFGKAGLNDWDRESRRIEVPRESRAQYLAALEESASLPITLRSEERDAINAATVFDSNDLRQARAELGRENDLSNTISAAFPEVKWASVEYDQGERRGLNRARPQSASVMVIPEGSGPLPRAVEQAIRELIRGSYAGMSADDVVVIDANSSSVSTLDDSEDPLLRKQRMIEAEYEHRLRKHLVGYPAAQIFVTAELDPTMDVQRTTLSYDAETTKLSAKERKVDTTTNRQAVGGVPGADPNARSIRNGTVEDNLLASKSSDKESEYDGVAGQKHEVSRTAPLLLRSIRVSVGLPHSYYKPLLAREWLNQAENKGKTIADAPPVTQDPNFEPLKTETEEKIKRAIVGHLPQVAAGASRDPLVVVWDYPDAAVPPVVEPETAKVLLTWLAQSWQTIALVFLGLVALLVARSAIKGPGETPPANFSEGFGLELPTPPPETEKSAEDDDRMTITGGTLKEELVGIVDSNPEVAANVIRGWVGEAA